MVEEMDLDHFRGAYYHVTGRVPPERCWPHGRRFTARVDGHTPLAGGTTVMLGLSTQGVVFYDQRNSELYDSLIRRAKHIECLLKLPRSPTAPSGTECGGQFSERPERGKHYLGNSVLYGHDNGLALIYGAVQGAWFFPACLAVLSLFSVQREYAPPFQPSWLLLPA